MKSPFAVFQSVGSAASASHVDEDDKATKATLRPRKIKKPRNNKQPDLAEQYREVQWLRDLVKYFERRERKHDR
jgi:hypothetical protein